MQSQSLIVHSLCALSKQQLPRHRRIKLANSSLFSSRDWPSIFDTRKQDRDSCTRVKCKTHISRRHRSAFADIRTRLQNAGITCVIVIVAKAFLWSFLTAFCLSMSANFHTRYTWYGYLTSIAIHHRLRIPCVCICTIWQKISLVAIFLLYFPTWFSPLRVISIFCWYFYSFHIIIASTRLLKWLGATI